MKPDLPDNVDIGLDIYNLARQLWPINRSITGEGVRETLRFIKSVLPGLVMKEIPSGTVVFDWTVPLEWRVREAYIIRPDGQKICDFAKNNLHLLGYSVPVRKRLTLDELQQHLYSIAEQPEAIPYVTSYYQERWGFCISHLEREWLPEGQYDVVIDSALFEGSLTYGELLIPGKSDKEVLISTYICHPSMANNELSGPSVTTYLSRWLLEQQGLYYSYRIIYIPETIGSIAYLSKHLDHLRNHVIAGFNVTCVGDERSYSFLPSRRGNTLSDAIAKHILKWIDPDFIIYDWGARGSDERQYCAPAVDLPIASIMRTKYGEYPEYHTSLDDLVNVVTPAGLQGGYEALRQSLEALERNVIPKIKICCEPHLSKRGLYPTLSTKHNNQKSQLMMDLITWSDGENDLLRIADKVNVPIWDLYNILEELVKYDLIEICDD